MGGLQVCPDIKLTKTERELRKTSYPDCIGFFPECVGITEPIPDCKTCPYWRKRK